MRLTMSNVVAVAVATMIGALLTSVDPAHAAPTPADRAPKEATDRAPVTVIVELAGDPVTVAAAAAKGSMTAAGRAEHRAAIRAGQQPVAAKIRSLGGVVLAQYQSAYNGLKVRIGQDRLARLDALPGVVAIHPVQPVAVSNTRGLPAIDAPNAWGNGVTGVRGEGIKVAVLDSGIDYTHLDFGGAGTAAAYQAAHAAETEAAPASMFGPSAPKVKGGIDLVGDSYNADSSSPGYQPVPHPDVNPLDCNGHGTHVAGSIAGFGVLSDGTAYRGLYGAYTLSTHTWRIGPGVAPKAQLYAVRVFGCQGTSDVLLDGIEWAVEHDMDVIAMALGSPFGTADTPEAVAADNAALDGALVVAASGSEGSADSPYLTSSPGSGNRVISVAASDPLTSYPGVHLALDTGQAFDAVNLNGAPLPAGTLTLARLVDSRFEALDGCDPQSWRDVDVAGKLVHLRTRYGPHCPAATVERLAADAGAAAVYISNSFLEPPWAFGEGNPDDGTRYSKAVPVLGPMPSNDGMNQQFTTATLSPISVKNPDAGTVASFSSSGPRFGDSWLKPDVTAPGANITSAGVGTGQQASTLSGTSMATAFTAGVAALVKQAHPTWDAADQRAAIASTADAGKIKNYVTRQAGNGLLQTTAATRTQAVALGTAGTTALNFGFAENSVDYDSTRTLTVHNHGDAPVTFTVKATRPGGTTHTVSLGATTLTVPANGQATLDVRLTAQRDAFYDLFFDQTQASGVVTLTPADGGNAGVTLRVPYYLVALPVSDVTTVADIATLLRTGKSFGVTDNRNDTPAYASWFTWTLKDGDEPALRYNDVRAVGVTEYQGEVQVNIGLYERVSNQAVNEYRVYVDTDRDGTNDFLIAGLDEGRYETGRPNGGLIRRVIYDLATGQVIGDDQRLVWADRDNAWANITFGPGELRSPGKPTPTAGSTFDYSVAVHSLLDGTTDVVDGVGSWTYTKPALGQLRGNWIYLPQYNENQTAWVPTFYDAAQFQLTPALGYYVLGLDNPARKQVQLIKVVPPAP